MGLERTLGFRWGQLYGAFVLLALAFLYDANFTNENLPPIAIICYLLGYYVHYWYRLYIIRRVVAFDVGGVLVTGDFYTSKLGEPAGMRNLLHDLRENYVVAILSNNNELTHPGMERRFGYGKVVDEVIYSSQVGAKKPDARIYSHLLSRFGVSAGRVVFVDDSPENVAAAKKLGIHAIQFDCNKQPVSQLRAALCKEGLRV